jgi:hypothetical protein
MRYNMKKNLITVLTFGLLAALMFSCNTEPVIKPDITGDSAMTMKIKNSIGQGQQVTTGWSWILWYVPVLFLVVAWGWREFVAKKPKDCPPTVTAKKKKKKPTSSAPSSKNLPAKN